MTHFVSPGGGAFGRPWEGLCELSCAYLFLLPVVVDLQNAGENELEDAENAEADRQSE